MGIDTALAIGELDADFICAICTDIVQNTVITTCEHYFCDSCIRPWIQRNAYCPTDRIPVEEAGLARPRRYFRNRLAAVRLRCPFTGCETETTYEGFEGHKTNCRKNPDAWMECAFCHVKHMINEEDAHKNTCLPFLHDKIAKKESEVIELTKKREAEKKEYEELDQIAKKPRTFLYILTWNAKFPAPQIHQMNSMDSYYTWNNCVGNLVKGTRKTNLRFKLDHGEMAVCLRLAKGTDERSIGVNFFLTTGKKRRVKFNYSLSVAGKVLWQKKERKNWKF